jgi:hypothetical protein
MQKKQQEESAKHKDTEERIDSSDQAQQKQQPQLQQRQQQQEQEQEHQQQPYYSEITWSNWQPSLTTQTKQRTQSSDQRATTGASLSQQQQQHRWQQVAFMENSSSNVSTSNTSSAGGHYNEKKIIYACEMCRKHHKACSGERPCKRCKEKGFECRDVVRNISRKGSASRKKRQQQETHISVRSMTPSPSPSSAESPVSMPQAPSSALSESIQDVGRAPQGEQLSGHLPSMQAGYTIFSSSNSATQSELSQLAAAAATTTTTTATNTRTLKSSAVSQTKQTTEPLLSSQRRQQQQQQQQESKLQGSGEHPAVDERSQQQQLYMDMFSILQSSYNNILKRNLDSETFSDSSSTSSPEHICEQELERTEARETTILQTKSMKKKKKISSQSNLETVEPDLEHEEGEEEEQIGEDAR